MARPNFIADFPGITRTTQKKTRHDVPAKGNMPAHHFFSYDDDGTETADVRVEIDVEAIVQMLGRRAMRNKNGKCVFMQGAVKLTATNRRVSK